MSLIQELGAQLRGTSDELPTGLVTVALERLRTATEILMWVRESSVDPIGVPQLSNATEHAERAAAALRIAQDAIAAYLSMAGLAGEASAPPDGDWRAGLERAGEPQPAESEDTPVAPEDLGPWWQQRVSQLTGEPPPSEKDRSGPGDPGPDGARRGPGQAGGQAGSKAGGPGGSKAGGQGGGPGGTGPAGAGDTAELLRRVASGVRAGDRARLGRDLHSVHASTGLALSAVAPPVLHRLAGDLLGHEPRPEDVPRLRSATTGRVRSLLPGTSTAVLDTLIDRICRVPASGAARPAGHPADNAVTASVLTGVLLARLGRDAATLDPSAPEPLRRPAGPPEPR